MTFQNKNLFTLSFYILCFKFSCAYKKESRAVNMAPLAEEKLCTQMFSFMSELSGA